MKIQAVVRGRNQRRADAAASVRCSDLLISFRFVFLASVVDRQLGCIVFCEWKLAGCAFHRGVS